MNTEIVESFSQMVREKSVDKDVLAGIIEEIFGLMVKKKFGQDAKSDVVVNMDKGDIEIFLERTIVDQVQDPSIEISIDEVNEKLKMNIKDNPHYDTFSGFILNHTGKIPKEGEEITYNKFKLKIEELTGQRISKVKVEQF